MVSFMYCYVIKVGNLKNSLFLCEATVQSRLLFFFSYFILLSLDFFLYLE